MISIIADNKTFNISKKLLETEQNSVFYSLCKNNKNNNNNNSIYDPTNLIIKMTRLDGDDFSFYVDVDEQIITHIIGKLRKCNVPEPTTDIINVSNQLGFSFYNNDNNNKSDNNENNYQTGGNFNNTLSETSDFESNASHKSHESHNLSDNMSNNKINKINSVTSSVFSTASDKNKKNKSNNLEDSLISTDRKINISKIFERNQPVQTTSDLDDFNTFSSDVLSIINASKGASINNKLERKSKSRHLQINSESY